MSSRRLCTLAALFMGLLVVGGCSKSSSRRGNAPPGGGGNTLTVTSVTPNAGVPAGGTTVTIAGTNFDL
ncbi:MAG: IPT/TIG domain-containing protein, partial [Planctomycetota bacterium]